MPPLSGRREQIYFREHRYIRKSKTRPVKATLHQCKRRSPRLYKGVRIEKRLPANFWRPEVLRLRLPKLLQCKRELKTTRLKSRDRSPKHFLHKNKCRPNRDNDSSCNGNCSRVLPTAKRLYRALRMRPNLLRIRMRAPIYSAVTNVNSTSNQLKLFYYRHFPKKSARNIADWKPRRHRPFSNL